jgi:hypothetical protein
LARGAGSPENLRSSAKSSACDPRAIARSSSLAIAAFRNSAMAQ